MLHLRDVARIELGTQTYDLTARYNNAPSAALAVYQLPGSNTVATAAAVTKRLQELSRTFPTGMEHNIPLDTTKAVTAGIHEIVVTLGLALLLVILVVFVFLQGWRATLIPLLAVPVSLIGTFIAFPVLGFSITLSLFGLVLAIGLVVDDAIIVVERPSVSFFNSAQHRLANLEQFDPIRLSEIAGVLLVRAIVPVFVNAKAAASDAVAFGVVERLERRIVSQSGFAKVTVCIGNIREIGPLRSQVDQASSETLPSAWPTHVRTKPSDLDSESSPFSAVIRTCPFSNRVLQVPHWPCRHADGI